MYYGSIYIEDPSGKGEEVCAIARSKAMENESPQPVTLQISGMGLVGFDKQKEVSVFPGACVDLDECRVYIVDLLEIDTIQPVHRNLSVATRLKKSPLFLWMPRIRNCSIIWLKSMAKCTVMSLISRKGYVLMPNSRLLSLEVVLVYPLQLISILSAVGL